jgi:hypothetical protein
MFSFGCHQTWLVSTPPIRCDIPISDSWSIAMSLKQIPSDQDAMYINVPSGNLLQFAIENGP